MTAPAVSVLPVPVAISKRKRSLPSLTARCRAWMAFNWYGRRKRSLFACMKPGPSGPRPPARGRWWPHPLHLIDPAALSQAGEVGRGAVALALSEGYLDGRLASSARPLWGPRQFSLAIRRGLTAAGRGLRVAVVVPGGNVPWSSRTSPRLLQRDRAALRRTGPGKPRLRRTQWIESTVAHSLTRAAKRP